MKRIEENIKKLIDGTRNGKIKWGKKNPTTYNWMTESSEGVKVNTIIQKFTSKEVNMLFRLWNLEEKYSYLDLQYKDCNDELKSLLRELYETVSGNNLFVEDIFSDILKDI